MANSEAPAKANLSTQHSGGRDGPRCAVLLVTMFLASWTRSARAQDPLPSWRDGAVKSAIVGFVSRVTTPGSPDFVPVEERLATFDNDGTLWSEKPLYFQLAFAIDRVKELAAQHPEWRQQQPFQAVLEGDRATLLSGGKQALLELLMATHAGMSTDEFERTVGDWLTTARHPRFDRPYTDLIYQPMLELIDYLRASGFQVWIVSAGGVEFMRVWCPRKYGIRREQIIGSSIRTELQTRGGRPLLVRQPEIDFIDDKEAKPVAIHKFIGRRPLAAFGNSDGDLQMLQWTTSGAGARFGLLVRHTDREREWAYDKKSAVGRLDQALDEAEDQGWTVADMRRDWKVVYPFQRADHHYFHSAEQPHAAAWGYAGPTGPEHWGDLDPSYRLAKRGRQQSPIDIRDPAPGDLPAITFSYRPSRINLVYNGHTIQENEDAGSFAMANSRPFELEQFHFHSPSEHTVNGHQFPMEMHLVHKAADGSVAVVAVFIQEGEPNAAFDPVWSNLPGPGRERQISSVTIDASRLLPDHRGYYFYIGSFTTPPCTEHVSWVVLADPVTLSSQQIAAFRQVIDGNNRPIQPLHGRRPLTSE